MTPAAFPFTTPANYTLSDNENFAVNGWLTLLPLDNIDNLQAEFDSGLNLGTEWNATYGVTMYPWPQEYAASWTPNYANITAYYKFNNSLAPSIGANTPTNTGTTNDPNGRLNQARSFVPNQTLFFGTGGFAGMGTADWSISGWFKLTTLPGTAYALMSTRNDGSCGHNWWTLFARSTGLGLEICSPNQALNGTIPLTANTWYFFTITRSGTNLTHYLNGEIDVTRTLPANFSFANGDGFYMGSQTNANWFLNGSLDEMTFWNVALTADKVKALYNNGNVPQELSSTWTPKWSNLVGYWKMNGDWTDSSGNGRNGTAQGGPLFNIDSQVGSFAGDFSASTSALIKIPNYNTIANRPTSQMTISAWVYSIANASAWDVIAAAWGADGPFHIAINPTNNLSLYIREIDGATPSIAETGTLFPLNRWVHVAAVADGTNLRLYRDGRAVGTPVPYDGTLISSVNCLALGNKLETDCTTSSVMGYRNKIDDLAFWNIGLTAEEIRTIYDAQAPYYSGELHPSWMPKYSNLLAHYNMDKGFHSQDTNYQMTATLGTPLPVSTSKVGSGALYLDGTAVLGNSTLGAALTNQSFSFSLWSNRSVNGAGDYMLGGGGTFGTNVSLHIGYRTSNAFTFAFYANDLDTVGYYADAGEWVHWAGTYNATNNRQVIYRNGVLENSRTAPADYQGGGYFCIGGVQSGTTSNCTNTGGGYQGNLDEIGIWQAELTAAEVQAIYERQKSQFQGEFRSRVMGTAGTTPAWTSQAWTTPIPFYKEMPDGGTSETTANYPSIIANLETSLLRLWHMNEASGTTLANTSGTGADNLTVTSGTVGEPGVFKNAVEVNGTTAYAISSNITTSTSVATISAWVYVTAYPASGKGHLVGMGNGNGGGSYDKNLGIDSTGKLYFYTFSGVVHETSAPTISIPLNTWTHIAGTVDATTIRAYMNGVEVGNTGSGGSSQATNSVLVGGYNAWAAIAVNRIVDEVALWSRALTATEISQLYRRGINRVKFQVRSCTDSACNGENWRGPDNTVNTYYSELFNMSTQAPAPSGTVLATSPVITHANFPPALTARPFYQYRTIFESDEVNSAVNLKTATVSTNPATIYPSNDKYATTMFTPESFVFKHLYSFTTVEDNVPCVNTYQISRDGTTFYYFNGATWVVGDTTTITQRNSAPTISSNLPSFNSQINNSGAGGTGNFYLRAFLNGNGSRACYIDNIAIQYD